MYNYYSLNGYNNINKTNIFFTDEGTTWSLIFFGENAEQVSTKS